VSVVFSVVDADPSSDRGPEPRALVATVGRAVGRPEPVSQSNADDGTDDLAVGRPERGAIIVADDARAHAAHAVPDDVHGADDDADPRADDVRSYHRIADHDDADPRADDVRSYHRIADHDDADPRADDVRSYHRIADHDDAELAAQSL